MNKNWVPFNLYESGAPVLVRVSAITKVTTTGVYDQTAIFGNWPGALHVKGSLLDIGKLIDEAESASNG